MFFFFLFTPKNNRLVTWGAQQLPGLLRINGTPYVRNIQVLNSSPTKDGNSVNAVLEVAVVDDQNVATVIMNV